MNEYQYWLDYFHILFGILIILLSWNSTFWIKDKINRILSFFPLLIFYHMLLSDFIKIDTYELATGNDPVLAFIFSSFTNNIIAKDPILYLSFITLGILILRLAYQFYQKQKNKIPT